MILEYILKIIVFKYRVVRFYVILLVFKYLNKYVILEIFFCLIID